MQIQMLLVDDQQTVLDALKELFDKRGFRVRTACSGREATGTLHENVFDLVVTDMRMETSTAGFDVIRAAKAQWYDPVVVILSAFPIRTSEWRTAGADAMFMKAENTRTMLDELERMLETRRTGSGRSDSLKLKKRAAPDAKAR